MKTERDLLQSYQRDIQDSHPLTRGEEAELAVRIHQGDMSARNALVQANLLFVLNIAKQYQNYGLSMIELVSAGNVGLITAAERFDETRGFKFITYAVWWIRQAIMQSLQEHTRTVRLPVNKQDRLRKIDKVMRRLDKENDAMPSTGEVATELGLSTEEVEEILVSDLPPRSLEQQIENEDRNLLSILADHSQESPDIEAEHESSKHRLSSVLLEYLDDRECIILKAYFGLDGEKPLTLEEIGALMGLTRERVRQLKVRALDKLRNSRHKRVLQNIQESLSG